MAIFKALVVKSNAASSNDHYNATPIRLLVEIESQLMYVENLLHLQRFKEFLQSIF